jgi:hypothetical protein
MVAWSAGRERYQEEAPRLERRPELCRLVDSGARTVLLEKPADMDDRDRRRGRLLVVVVVLTRDEPGRNVWCACCEVLHRRGRSRASRAFHGSVRRCSWCSRRLADRLGTRCISAILIVRGMIGSGWDLGVQFK